MSAMSISAATTLPSVRPRGGRLPSGKLPVVSREEVAKHRRYDDCWVILDGDVLALPPTFLEDHPGGSDAIFQMAGQDLSQDFHASGHSASASSSAKVFAVGRLAINKKKEEKFFTKPMVVAAMGALAFFQENKTEDAGSRDSSDVFLPSSGEYLSIAVAALSAASAGLLAWRLSISAVNA